MERFYPGWPDYKVTSLLSGGRLPQDMRIDIYLYEFAVSPEQAQMWCIEKLDYTNIIGDVHFNNVMLNDKRSDLTAIFWIIKVDEQNLTLLFKDLHVM